MYAKTNDILTFAATLAAAIVFCAYSLPASAKASPDPATLAEKKMAQDDAKKAGVTKKGTPAKTDNRK